MQRQSQWTSLCRMLLLRHVDGRLHWAVKRCHTKPTSLSERSVFVLLWVGGRSIRSIARDTGVSSSTVCRWIHSYHRGGEAAMARSVVLLVAGLLQLVASQRTLLPDNHESQALRSAAASVLAAHTPCPHATVFVTDAAEEGEMLQAPRGVAVFREVDGGNVRGNSSQAYLGHMAEKIHQMGGAWHCLVVVVVSDDPAFLAAFAHLSLRRHALRWSTRILVLTRLPLSHLGGLHGLLSNRNAMLLQVKEGEEAARKVNVLAWQPCSAPSSTPLTVATWTLHGRLTLTSHVPLFPDKFSVFTTPPTLSVAVEFLPYHTLTWVENPHEPGGRRLLLTGFMNNFVMYFAKAMNFKYRYVLSHERTFGNKLPNGSWTGMLGMVVREEADFSPAPFALNPARNEAVDPSSVYGIVQVRILSGLTGLKIDPWGFLLPLTHLVWAVTLAALLGVLFVLQLFPSCLPGKSLLCNDWSVNSFSPVRILLQQDVVWPAQWWWWERLVLGLWMLATLVLTKSYAGNLISLLAVRYVPQPFQTLQDIVDNVRVAVIAQKHSTFEQSLRDVKYGVFHEIAELEDKGRLNFLTHSELAESLDTLVRAGHHVLVDLDVNHMKRMSLDFSRKGRCDFYRSRDSYLPLPCSMVVQKTSPLLHGINKGLMTLFEKGIIQHWTDSDGNLTVCNNIPKKVIITSHISLSNIWGVFAMLGGGLTAGLVVWCAELVFRPSQQH